MPDADEIVVSAWHSLGLTGKSIISPMGDEIKQPLEWSEISAYSQCTTGLTSWECRQVKRMSSDYIKMLSEATKYRNTKSPYDPDIEQHDVEMRVTKIMGLQDESDNKLERDLNNLGG